jgi:hypothetical protein
MKSSSGFSAADCLEELGYRVETAISVSEAINKIERVNGEFDLAIYRMDCPTVKESFWLASCLPSILAWRLPSSVMPMHQIFADVSQKPTVSPFYRNYTVRTNCERWLRAIVPLERRYPHCGTGTPPLASLI